MKFLVKQAQCIASLAVVALIGAQETLAQEARQPPADAKPMSTIVVDRSMAQLLQEGYEIVSFSAGLGGFGYLLKHDRSWRPF